jgi:alpha-L-fucosidase
MKSFIRSVFVLLIVLFCFSGTVLSAQVVPETEHRKEVVQKWRDLGFGMFIHWGAYTQLQGRWKAKDKHGVLGDKGKTMDLWGEWIMKRAHISVADYEKAIKGFSPDEFDAGNLAELAADAGMKYMVITAKHHDGFAMYPSKATKYNIKDHCGFKRDPMMELSEACKKHGVKFGFYYSHRVDWHEPGGGGYRGENKGSFDDYWKNKVIPQVTEITTQYGPLGTVWFDLNCSAKDKVTALRALVLKNQPDAMISSRIGCQMGDFKSLKDRQIPAMPVSAPSETCMTLNEHWAHYPQDVYYKSAEDVIRMLVSIRAKGANLLLNIGPDEKGRIPLLETVVLKKVGEWMKKFSDSIYGVKATILPPLPWGECTVKGNTLYLHLFKLPADGTLFVPGLKSEVKRAYFLGAPDAKALSVEKRELGVNLIFDPLKVPVEALDDYDTVVALECVSKPEADKVVCLDHDFDNVFSPKYAKSTGGVKSAYKRLSPVIEIEPVIGTSNYFYYAGKFENEGSALNWVYNNGREDGFFIAVDYALAPGSGDVELLLDINGQKLTAKLTPTDKTPVHMFRKKYLKTLVLAPGKAQTITLKVKSPLPAKGLKIRSVILRPSHLEPPYNRF